MLIKRVEAKIIKDSRNQNTISVRVNNSKEASAPSGKSTGKYESKPYHKSLRWNINYLNKWNHEIKISKFDDLKKVEDAICKDLKIKDIREFGANALFAFESAILKALAKEQNKELWEVINPKAKNFPRPVGNAIGGGLHSSKSLSYTEFQEFLLIPNEKTFRENVKMMKKIYSKLKKYSEGRPNDEGAHNVKAANEEIMNFIYDEINNTKTEIGLDVAANTLFKKNAYTYRKEKLKRREQINKIENLAHTFNILYIEDPLEETDFKGFTEIQKNVPKRTMIVGDDLTATQPNRLDKAIKTKSISAMIVKPNQHGSLLTVRNVIKTCKKNKIKTILSHRSGETMDDALADYAFGFRADFIKCGIATKWRETKLKRMVKIEKSNKQ